MKIEHIGVVVSDMDQAVRTYESLFGCSVLSGPFEDPLQQATVCFVGDGEGVMIEVVAPLGQDSHVARLLARGAGAYHVCYQVDELDKTLGHMKSKGCLVVRDPVPAVAYGGRRIAWLYAPTRHLVELVER